MQMELNFQRVCTQKQFKTYYRLSSSMSIFNSHNKRHDRIAECNTQNQHIPCHHTDRVLTEILYSNTRTQRQGLFWTQFSTDTRHNLTKSSHITGKHNFEDKTEHTSARYGVFRGWWRAHVVASISWGQKGTSMWLVRNSQLTRR
jgi:hypothetical protein